MRIRNATFDDLEQISNLESIWCPSGAATYDDFVDFYKNKSSGDFLEVIVSDQNYKEVLGFIGLQFHQEDKKCHIWNLAVFPNYRRSGLAMRLVKHSLQLSREHGMLKVFLEVSEFNQEAISLYKKIGFEVKSFEKNYYENGEGCFHLEQILHE